MANEQNLIPTTQQSESEARENSRKGGIEIIEHENVNTYVADPIAVKRIQTLPDDAFEKEIAKFPEDTQTFLRLARGHKNEG